ncbi:unnamed protein product, partial [Pylaiella littoralis]
MVQLPPPSLKHRPFDFFFFSLARQQDTSCDYTDVFCRAAANSGQKHPITQGFRVVKVAHNHYEV